MGLNDLKSEGDWRLASNDSKKPSYLNWHEGKPSNRTDEDCARLRIGPFPEWKNTWADEVCTTETVNYQSHGSYSQHALCEYDSWTTSSTDDTTTKGASTKS